jgi:hypothetical protein
MNFSCPILRNIELQFERIHLNNLQDLILWRHIDMLPQRRNLQVDDPFDRRDNSMVQEVLSGQVELSLGQIQSCLIHFYLHDEFVQGLLRNHLRLIKFQIAGNNTPVCFHGCRCLFHPRLCPFHLEPGVHIIQLNQDLPPLHSVSLFHKNLMNDPRLLRTDRHILKRF